MITLAGNLTLTFLWPKSVANAQEVFAAQTKLDEVPDLLRDQDWLQYDEWLPLQTTSPLQRIRTARMSRIVAIDFATS